MSKGGFMKDAMILFAITLVSGACLGGVYEITKDPIALPSAIPLSPFLVATMDVTSSGSDVPIAMIVSPIKFWLRCFRD